jgi:hypothetical protein
VLASLIDTIAKAYDAQRHRELLAALWRQERWFDTPHQRRAAQIARDVLAGAGLADVAIVPYAADGRTRWQDWTTHLAWDCSAAEVRIGEEVLADRASCPQSAVYWSGPLKRTTAPAIDGDALESVAPEDVRGRFVLTAKPPRDMKQRLLAAEPAAVISDYVGRTRGADEHTTKWCNAWADGPGGWYFRACDRVMPGFCLSPAAGRRLRERLAAEPGLRITASCDSRLYEGIGQCVTGVVPGRDAAREVWLFGHACEQGAHDNCSGVSIYVEAARLLAELIGAGVLGRPRCGIRVVTTEECLGMLAFATEHPGLLGRAVAGTNVDAAGDATEPDRPMGLHYGPLSMPNFGWAVAGELGRLLADRSGGAYHVRCECEPPSSDDQIADPNCGDGGVPTLWLGTGGDATGYHSSADTPAVCSDVTLRSNLLLVAAWAYVMADLDDRRVAALLPAARRWIDQELLAGHEGDGLRLRRWAAGRMLRQPARWGVSPAACETAAAEYCPPSAEPLDGLPTAGPRYARRTWGTCTLETLAADRTEGLSRWNRWQNAALFWTHGRRALAAVERLVSAEVGRAPEGGCARLFEACVEAGLAQKEDE